MDPQISELAYRNLMERRTVMLDAPIDDPAASAIVAQLLLIADQGNEPIQLLVNSPGGPMPASLAILDTMEEIDPAIATVCTGQASGTAVMIVAAGSPSKRVATPHARFLLLPVEPGREYRAEELDDFLRYRKQYYQRFAQLTGRTPEEIEADCEKRRFLDAPAALEYGIIDEVRTKGARD